MDILRRIFGKSNASTSTPTADAATPAVSGVGNAATSSAHPSGQNATGQNGNGTGNAAAEEARALLENSNNMSDTPPVPAAPSTAPATPAPAASSNSADTAYFPDKYATRDLTPDMIPGSTRQLPPLEAFVSKPGRHITYGVHSHTGMVRSNNQDALFAMFSSNFSAGDVPDFGLFVVADGMGGHHDGEKASALATRMIARYVSEHFFLKLLNTKDGDDRPIISEVLNEAVQSANRSISEQIPEGGTTCTAVTILGDLAYIAHVGDSRAYLLAEGGIEQITRDHSLVQRLIELDQLTNEEAAQHPQRNVLYRALGQSESLDVDAITRRLPPASRLLICSDGLWNHVPESLVVQIIRTSKTPQEACDKLVASANERGGLDNITAIVVQVPG